MGVDLTFIGCGDAFGSGGRFNTCFHIASRATTFLVDCGASSLIAMKKLAIDPNGIRTILITHFHADHFGGLPFFLLDARFFSKRTSPLTLAGPPGINEALLRYQETFFPGSSDIRLGFDLELRELKPGQPNVFNSLAVTPYEVNHGKPGGAYLAYRIEVERKTIAYTGDTEWTDTLIPLGKEADLLIAEAYFLDRPVTLHLDLKTLEAHLPMINPHRLILTHMSESLLRQAKGLNFELAEDGLRIRC
ncbi:MAG: MBL fold metallo-hydrolase [Notoacmeibacter sp.]|nr:MBL fold metallo-hydrolase [Notoacmeibacter sp.]